MPVETEGITVSILVSRAICRAVLLPHSYASTIYTLPTAHPFTYDHRTLKIRLPVRSAIYKQCTGGLVVRWVTTSESPLLYVFVHLLHPPYLLAVLRTMCSFLSYVPYELRHDGYRARCFVLIVLTSLGLVGPTCFVREERERGP